MDDLLSEFLTETNESLDSLDMEVVKLEQDPNDPDLLSGIFRLVHTIKGTCGFLGLPRLESVAHAGENILGKFRDGELPVTPEAVTLILEALDCIKSLLSALEDNQVEPDGDDAELIGRLNAMANGEVGAAPAADKAVEEEVKAAPAAPAKPLIDRVGGISSIDAVLDIVFRKIMADSEISHFIDEADSIIVQGRSLEYLVAAFGGPDNYSGGDLVEAFRGSVGDGLSDAHFDAVIGYFKDALVDLEVTEDAQEDAVEILEGTREAILNKVEAAKKAEAVAVAAKEAETAAAEEAGPKKESAVATQSVRVTVDLLENLMTMVSELVLSRNQLLQMLRSYEDSEFTTPLQRLSLITTDLQEAVMKTRMQPIGNAWTKLPRIVRDLSHELDKKIDLEMLGADTELDRQVLEMIKDPLTHMIRNSGDHGLETPSERVAAGKPQTGKIVLNAYHEGGHIIIQITDDGRGIAVDKVRAKAVANGIATEEQLNEMTSKQIVQYIFKAGFSTAEKVTNVSGRGVGMDVVRTNIEKIGGHVELATETGKGSTFTVKIPLTLAIVSALIVECGGERFAVPQLNVDELVRVSEESEHRIENVNDTPVLRLRDRLLPLVALDELLGLKSETELKALIEDTAVEAVSSDADEEEASVEETFIVVIRVGTTSFGVIVDRVFESEEIVVKPVTSALRDVAIFSGNTILGDGSVIMILDPNGIADTFGANLDNDGHAEETSVLNAQERAAAQRTAILVFRAGTEEPMAVPLALVARLEEIPVEDIEVSDGKLVVQYRGRLMPLLTLADDFKRAEEERQHVIVFADGDQSMGLMVDEIVDIVEDRLDVEIGSGDSGILGTAVVGGKATEVIDTAFYLKKAFGNWFVKANKSGTGVPGRGNSRILLVDDSPFFRNLLTPLLSVAGYEVTAVEGGEAALSLREQGHDFDIIVSDIEMPGMNGFELAQEIKSGGAWATKPLLALSSFSSRADLEKGREAGFQDYIVKLDRDALLESLSQTLVSIGDAA
jgi:two-component system chemotaxis sensor kinase CheA